MSLKKMNLTAEEMAVAEKAVLRLRRERAVLLAQLEYTKHILNLALETLSAYGRDASLDDFIAVAGDDGFDPFKSGRMIPHSDTYAIINRVIEFAHTSGIRHVNIFSYDDGIDNG